MRGGGKERRKKKREIACKKNSGNKELMFLEAVSKEGVKSTFLEVLQNFEIFKSR
jgi:hypothetical protein